MNHVREAANKLNAQQFQFQIEVGMKCFYLWINNKMMKGQTGIVKKLNFIDEKLTQGNLHIK